MSGHAARRNRVNRGRSGLVADAGAAARCLATVVAAAASGRAIAAGRDDDSAVLVPGGYPEATPLRAMAGLAVVFIPAAAAVVAIAGGAVVASLVVLRVGRPPGPPARRRRICTLVTVADLTTVQGPPAATVVGIGHAIGQWADLTGPGTACRSAPSTRPPVPG